MTEAQKRRAKNALRPFTDDQLGMDTEKVLDEKLHHRNKEGKLVPTEKTFEDAALDQVLSTWRKSTAQQALKMKQMQMQRALRGKSEYPKHMRKAIEMLQSGTHPLQ